MLEAIFEFSRTVSKIIITLTAIIFKTMTNIDQIRRDYMLRSLDVADLKADPFNMFEVWFDEAIKSNVLDATAMTLSTVDENNQPSSRVVLLKGVEEKGFVFFTNYNSKKGQDIVVNPKVCLSFFWPELERQVMIHGICTKIPAQDSEKYFRSRPYESQIGAWASEQSNKLSDRQTLQNAYEQLKQKYPDTASIPYPDHWGGYKVVPTNFEFWQGRASRLHDRFEYILKDGSWIVQRLYP